MSNSKAKVTGDENVKIVLRGYLHQKRIDSRHTQTKLFSGKSTNTLH